MVNSSYDRLVLMHMLSHQYIFQLKCKFDITCAVMFVIMFGLQYLILAT